MPNNLETLCHVCGCRRVDGPTTDALQAAVAAWLIDYDVGLGVRPGESYEAQAADLLAVIARTLRAHKPPEADW